MIPQAPPVPRFVLVWSDDCWPNRGGAPIGFVAYVPRPSLPDDAPWWRRCWRWFEGREARVASLDFNGYHWLAKGWEHLLPSLQREIEMYRSGEKKA
jgi:hypothetical protein